MPRRARVAGHLLVHLQIRRALGRGLLGTGVVAAHRRGVGVELAGASDRLAIARRDRTKGRVATACRGVHHLAVGQRIGARLRRVGHRHREEVLSRLRIQIRLADLGHLQGGRVGAHEARGVLVAIHQGLLGQRFVGTLAAQPRGDARGLAVLDHGALVDAGHRHHARRPAENALIGAHAKIHDPEVGVAVVQGADHVRRGVVALERVVHRHPAHLDLAAVGGRAEIGHPVVEDGIGRVGIGRVHPRHTTVTGDLTVELHVADTGRSFLLDRLLDGHLRRLALDVAGDRRLVGDRGTRAHRGGAATRRQRRARQGRARRSGARDDAVLQRRRDQTRRQRIVGHASGHDVVELALRVIAGVTDLGYVEHGDLVLEEHATRARLLGRQRRRALTVLLELEDHRSQSRHQRVEIHRHVLRDHRQRNLANGVWLQHEPAQRLETDPRTERSQRRRVRLAKSRIRQLVQLELESGSGTGARALDGLRRKQHRLVTLNRQRIDVRRQILALRTRNRGRPGNAGRQQLEGRIAGRAVLVVGDRLRTLVLHDQAQRQRRAGGRAGIRRPRPLKRQRSLALRRSGGRRQTSGHHGQPDRQ